MLAFAFGLALLTGVLFGAAPAWFATRTNPIDALRGAGRSTGDHSSFTRKALVVAAGGGVGRARRRLDAAGAQPRQPAGPGRSATRSPDRVLVAIEPAAGRLRRREARVALSRHRGSPQGDAGRARRRARALQPAHRQLGRAGAGLRQAAAAARPAGRRLVGSRQRQLPAGPRRRSLVRGRHFSARDTETTEHVAVVNEVVRPALLQQDEDPLDQHFGLDLPENVNTYRIVGVVRDARFAGFGFSQPPRPMFYVALAQTVAYNNPMMKRLETASHQFARGILLVTERRRRRRSSPLVMRTLAAADPNLTVTSVRTLQQQIDRGLRSAARGRQPGRASSASSRSSLAAIGLYGVTAYARRAADQGDGRADGARRRPPPRRRHGARRRLPPRRRRARARPAARGRRRLPAVGAALRRVVLGSAGARPPARSRSPAAAFVAAIMPARRAASISPIRALRTD